jgi:hypothetical protein
MSEAEERAEYTARFGEYVDVQRFILPRRSVANSRTISITEASQGRKRLEEIVTELVDGLAPYLVDHHAFAIPNTAEAELVLRVRMGALDFGAVIEHPAIEDTPELRKEIHAVAEGMRPDMHEIVMEVPRAIPRSERARRHV